MILKYITSLLILVLITQEKNCFGSRSVMNFYLGQVTSCLGCRFSSGLVVNAKLKFSSRQWPSYSIKVPTVNIRINRGSDPTLKWIITSTLTVF